MRALIIPAIAIGLLLTACKGKNKATTITSEDGKSSVTIDTKNTGAITNEMEKKMEELKKLPPLTVDQLKAMLPEELAGIKRSSFNANSMMGFAVADADYKKDDTTDIKLTVYDCAGEAGAGFYGLSYWTKMSMESQSDDGYTKTVDFMGNKAVEDYKKYNNTYSLTYATNDRLLVSLQGHNTGIDLLKDAAKSLNLK